MTDGRITEEQLAAYEPRTPSGAALKERLEAAIQQDSEPTGPGQRVLR